MDKGRKGKLHSFFRRTVSSMLAIILFMSSFDIDSIAPVFLRAEEMVATYEKLENTMDINVSIAEGSQAVLEGKSLNYRVYCGLDSENPIEVIDAAALVENGTSRLSGIPVYIVEGTGAPLEGSGEFTTPAGFYRVQLVDTSINEGDICLGFGSVENAVTGVTLSSIPESYYWEGNCDSQLVSKNVGTTDYSFNVSFYSKDEVSSYPAEAVNSISYVDGGSLNSKNGATSYLGNSKFIVNFTKVPDGEGITEVRISLPAIDGFTAYVIDGVGNASRYTGPVAPTAISSVVYCKQEAVQGSIKWVDGSEEDTSNYRRSLDEIKGQLELYAYTAADKSDATLCTSANISFAEADSSSVATLHFTFSGVDSYTPSGRGISYYYKLASGYVPEGKLSIAGEENIYYSLAYSNGADYGQSGDAIIFTKSGDNAIYSTDFYLVWHDEAAYIASARPEMNYSLYYTLGDEPESDMRPYNLSEYSMSIESAGSEEEMEAGSNPYYQRISFADLKGYDNGQRVHYYLKAQVKSQAGSAYNYCISYYDYGVGNAAYFEKKDTVSGSAVIRHRGFSDGIIPCSPTRSYAKEKQVIEFSLSDSFVISGSIEWKNVKASATKPDCDVYLYRYSSHFSTYKRSGSAVLSTAPASGYVDATSADSSTNNYTFSSSAKYDYYGSPYTYEIAEFIKVKNSSTAFPSELMQGQVVDNENIVNTFDPDNRNQREFDVKVGWQLNGQTLSKEPVTKISLFRVEKSPALGENYADILSESGEFVETKYISYTNSVSTNNFSKQPIYAPSGIQYLYFIVADDSYLAAYQITNDESEALADPSSNLKVSGNIVMFSNSGLSLSTLVSNKKTTSFTNTIRSDKLTKITGTITWNEGITHIGDSSRPTIANAHDYIKFSVLRSAEGQALQSNNQTLENIFAGNVPDANVSFAATADANVWTYTITLPAESNASNRFAVNGSSYKYLVSESYVADTSMSTNYYISSNDRGESADSANAAGELEIDETILNNLKGSLKAVALWTDGYNSYDMRPEKALVMFEYKDGDTWKPLRYKADSSKVIAYELSKNASYAATLSKFPVSALADKNEKLLYRAVEIAIINEDGSWIPTTSYVSSIDSANYDADSHTLDVAALSYDYLSEEYQLDSGYMASKKTFLSYQVYQANYAGLSGASITTNISNRLTGSTKLTVTQNWDDQKNAFGSRPTSFNLILEKRIAKTKTGEGIYSVTTEESEHWTEVKTISVKASASSIIKTDNAWTLKLENLPLYDAQGNIYAYRAVEVVPGSYQLDTSNYGGNETGYTSSFDYSIDKTEDITVNTKWAQGFTTDEYSSTVSVTLVFDDESTLIGKYTLQSDDLDIPGDGFSHTFNMVPAYIVDGDGNQQALCDVIVEETEVYLDKTYTVVESEDEDGNVTDVFTSEISGESLTWEVRVSENDRTFYIMNEPLSKKDDIIVRANWDSTSLVNRTDVDLSSAYVEYTIQSSTDDDLSYKYVATVTIPYSEEDNSKSVKDLPIYRNGKEIRYRAIESKISFVLNGTKVTYELKNLESSSFDLYRTIGDGAAALMAEKVANPSGNDAFSYKLGFIDVAYDGSFSYTNSLAVIDAKLTVNYENDSDNKFGTRFASSSAVLQCREANAGAGWTNSGVTVAKSNPDFDASYVYEKTGLPVYFIENGALVEREYRLIEASQGSLEIGQNDTISGGYSLAYSAPLVVWDLILTKHLETTTLSGYIVWKDDNNIFADRPAFVADGEASSVKLKIYEGGSIFAKQPKIQWQTVAEDANKWHYVSSYLPAYKINGNAPAVYTVNEILSSSAYSISYEGNTITNELTKIKLQVSVLDGSDNAKLSGVSVKVSNKSNASECYTGTTDSEGKACIWVNGIGNYMLTETKVPGYEEYSGTEINLTAEDLRTTVELTIKNKRKTGQIKIRKVDDQGALVKNVKFELYRETEVVGTFTSIWNFITGNRYEKINLAGTEDATGLTTIAGLEWGRYYIVETEAEGYGLDTTKYYFEVNASNVDNDIVFTGKDNNTIVNNPLGFTFKDISYDGVTYTSGGLYEFKKNGVTLGEFTIKDAASGVKFVNANPSSSKAFYANADGSIYYVKNLGAYSYSISQKEAPLGFDINSTTIDFEMGIDGVITVSSQPVLNKTLILKNMPMADFTVTKVFANEGDYAGGVRPAEISVQLYSKVEGQSRAKKGAAVKLIISSAADSFTHNFSDLPMCTEEGKKITYEVEEVASGDADQNAYDVSLSAVGRSDSSAIYAGYSYAQTITNTFNGANVQKTSASLRVNYEDDFDNAYGSRFTTGTAVLQSREKGLTGNWTEVTGKQAKYVSFISGLGLTNGKLVLKANYVAAAGTYTYSITNLPKRYNNKEYDYRIVEVSQGDMAISYVDALDSAISNIKLPQNVNQDRANGGYAFSYTCELASQNVATLTKKLIKKSITGTIEWEDYSNSYNTRPSIASGIMVLRVYENGNLLTTQPDVTMSDYVQNTWSYDTGKLPKYVANSDSLAMYSVIGSISDKRYKTENLGNFAIKNTLKTITITATKRWKNDDSNKPAFDVSFRLYSKVEGGDYAPATLYYGGDNQKSLTILDMLGGINSVEWKDLPAVTADGKDLIYKVVEETTNADYETSCNMTETKLDAEFVFTNRQYHKLTIKAVDKTTNAPMSGVHFVVKNTATGSVVAEANTDGNGKLVVNKLKSASYTIEESRPTGYESMNPISLELSEDDDERDHELTVENIRKTGTLTIHKVDRDEKYIKGVEFELYKKNNSNVWDKLVSFITGNVYSKVDADATVDPSGLTTISGIEWGDYYIVEKRADGYIFDESQKYHFTVDADTVESQLVLREVSGNKIYNTAIRFFFKKKSIDDVVLSGGLFEIKRGEESLGTFTIKSTGGVEIVNANPSAAESCYATDDGLMVYVKSLAEGEYTIVELEAPEGYGVNEEPVSFTLTKDGRIIQDGSERADKTLTMEDMPVASLIVTKKFVGDEDFAEEIRPATIMLQLRRKVAGETSFTDYGDPEYMSIDFSEEDSTYTFEDLPMYVITGGSKKTVVYDVLEVQDPEDEGANMYKATYSPVNRTDTNIGYYGYVFEQTITNTYDETKVVTTTVKLTVNYADDMDNTYETRFTSGKAILQYRNAKDNEEGSWKAVNASEKLAAYISNISGIALSGKAIYITTEYAEGDESYEYEATKLPRVLNGKLIEYRMLESQQDNIKVTYSNATKADNFDILLANNDAGDKASGGYLFEYSYSDTQAESTLTKSLVTRTITAKKRWVDSEDAYGTRASTSPDDFAIIVKADGVELEEQPDMYIEEHEEDASLWLIESSDLPKYKAKSNTKINYSIREQYDNKQYSGSQDGSTFTNTLKNLTISAKVKWLNDTGKATSDVTFRLESKIAGSDDDFAAANLGSESAELFLDVEEMQKGLSTVKWSKIPSVDYDGNKLAYRVVETTSDDFYTITCDKTSASESATFTFTNKQKPVLQIKALDKTSKEPMANVKFTITCSADTSIHYEKSTNSDGIIEVLAEKMGTYHIVQERQLGYESMDIISETFKNSDTKYTHTVNVLNVRKTGTIQIHKVDGEGEDAAYIKGVEFELYKETSASGFEYIWKFLTGNKYSKVKASATTDSTGVTTISNLEWGKYYIVETKADGYVFKDTRYYFDVDASTVENAITLKDVAGNRIVNYENTFTFEKHSFVGDEVLYDSEFTIYRVNGKKETKVETFTLSKEQKSKVFKKYTPGEYVIKENKVHEGFAPSTEGSKLYIDSHGQILKSENGDYWPNGIVVMYAMPLMTLTVNTTFVNDSTWKDMIRPSLVTVQLYSYTDDVNRLTEVKEANEILVNKDKSVYTLEYTDLPMGREDGTKLYYLAKEIIDESESFYKVENFTVEDGKAVLKRTDGGSGYSGACYEQTIRNTIDSSKTVEESVYITAIADASTGNSKVFEYNLSFGIKQANEFAYKGTYDIGYLNEGRFRTESTDNICDENSNIKLKKEQTARVKLLRLASTDYVIFDAQEILTDTEGLVNAISANASKQELETFNSKTHEYSVAFVNENLLKNQVIFSNSKRVYTKISNETLNDERVGKNETKKKNAGGYIYVIKKPDQGSSAYDGSSESNDSVEYKEGALGVKWIPMDYWDYLDEFKVIYKDSATEKENTIVVSDFMNKDGTIKPASDSCYNALREKYGNFTITQNEKGAIILYLADSADGLPYVNDIEVSFAPTIAVYNATGGRIGGGVKIDESGEYLANSDGTAENSQRRYSNQVKVYAKADTKKGYYVDIKNIQLKNVGSVVIEETPAELLEENKDETQASPETTVTEKVNAAIKSLGPIVANAKEAGFALDSNKNFTASLDYDMAGKTSEYNFKGKIKVLEKDRQGHPTSVCIEMNSLLIPIDIGVTFVKAKPVSASGGEAEESQTIYASSVTANSDEPQTNIITRNFYPKSSVKAGVSNVEDLESTAKSREDYPNAIDKLMQDMKDTGIDEPLILKVRKKQTDWTFILFMLNIFLLGLIIIRMITSRNTEILKEQYELQNSNTIRRNRL